MEKYRSMEAVFFDLDGTLVKIPIDYELMRNELKLIAKKYGLYSEFKPLFKEIKRLSSLHSEGDKFAKECLEVIKKYEIKGAEKAELLKGVKEILYYLKSKGIKIAIISNNSKDCIEKVLEVTGIRNLIDLVIGRNSIENLKPNPLPIINALKILNVRKVIFVGDREEDKIAANKAGIEFIEANKINELLKYIQ
ncbi:MAG: HAD family hydrolase [Candidatus Verstraetearchaeota archaeon]|nr:HAD family hydrolase [Candidatus Verstraetearchaeota archaeon]